MSFQAQSTAQSFQPAKRGTSSLACFPRVSPETVRMLWLGFCACLLIAYLHPSMLWTPELPAQLAPLAVPISVLMTGMWIAFGWRILRLSRLAPVGASLTYAIGRGGHLFYRWYSAGEVENLAMILMSIVLMAGLLVSAGAVFRAHFARRRGHRTGPLTSPA